MKDTRMEFRSSPEEKDLLIRAAQLLGVNVSVSLRNAAIEAANKAIQENENMKLSNRDPDLFLQTLDHPPFPNTRLKKAMHEFEQWKQNP